MKTKKERFRKISKQFISLKEMVRHHRRLEKQFIQYDCKELLKAYKNRWNITPDEIIDDAEINLQVKALYYDLYY